MISFGCLTMQVNRRMLTTLQLFEIQTNQLLQMNKKSWSSYQVAMTDFIGFPV